MRTPSKSSRPLNYLKPDLFLTKTILYTFMDTTFNITSFYTIMIYFNIFGESAFSYREFIVINRIGLLTPE